MKSIQEKVEDYLQDNKDEILNVYDRFAGFVDGANYVLDLLIEEDDKYETVMECYPALTRIIRELKK